MYALLAICHCKLRLIAHSVIVTLRVVQVKRYREAELTHGRVSMLAAVGVLVGEAVQDKTLFYNWDGQIKGAHFKRCWQNAMAAILVHVRSVICRLPMSDASVEQSSYYTSERLESTIVLGR